MGELGYDPDAVGSEGSPSAVGVEAAAAVLAFRHGDGANQLGDLGPEPGGPAAAYADWELRPGTETPPGHWCRLAQQVSARDGHGLDEDAPLFFALTAALLDAGIACWDAKRAFDSVRPVTAIRFQYAGQEVLAWCGPGLGPRPIKGEAWRP
jgi:hypothetical protein